MFGINLQSWNKQTKILYWHVSNFKNKTKPKNIKVVDGFGKMHAGLYDIRRNKKRQDQDQSRDRKSVV